jgi:hypothetical protein
MGGWFKGLSGARVSECQTVAKGFGVFIRDRLRCANPPGSQALPPNRRVAPERAFRRLNQGRDAFHLDQNDAAIIRSHRRAIARISSAVH